MLFHEMLHDIFSISLFPYRARVRVRDRVRVRLRVRDPLRLVMGFKLITFKLITEVLYAYISVANFYFYINLLHSFIC